MQLHQLTFPYWPFHVSHDQPILVVEKFNPDLCNLGKAGKMGSCIRFLEAACSTMLDLLVAVNRKAASHLAPGTGPANNLHDDSQLDWLVLRNNLLSLTEDRTTQESGPLEKDRSAPWRPAVRQLTTPIDLVECLDRFRCSNRLGGAVGHAFHASSLMYCQDRTLPVYSNYTCIRICQGWPSRIR